MAGGPIAIVNSGGDAEGPTGNIFKGISFFVLQRVPTRTEIVNKILNNGGKIVQHEKAAEYLIADHARKDCPPGSISWTFINASLRAETLVNPDAHRAGPGQSTTRIIGSAVPGKGTRTPFTADDDCLLWEWVERAQLAGGRIKGNEIYKQLEAHNSRHTFQAWRDRYLKNVMHRPPPEKKVLVTANAPPPAVDRYGSTKAAEEQPCVDLPANSRRSEYIETTKVADGTQLNRKLGRKADTHDRPGPANRVGGFPDHSDRAYPRLTSTMDPSDRFERKRKRGANSGLLQHTDSRAIEIDGVSDALSEHMDKESLAADQGHIHNLNRVQNGTAEYQTSSQPRFNLNRKLYGRLPGDMDLNSVRQPPTENNDRSGSEVTSTSTFNTSTSNQDRPRALQNSRTVLTEANLANHQALERGQPIRETDLLEDDHMQDQTAYAEYLRNQLPRSFLQRLGTSQSRESHSKSTPTADAGQLPRSTLPPNRIEVSNTRTNPSLPSRTRVATPESRETSSLPESSINDRWHSHSSHDDQLSKDEMETLQVEDYDDIDLGVPLPPEDDWNNKNLSVEDDLDNHTQSSLKHRHALDTQDIVNAETQYPDLELPLPPATSDDNDDSYSDLPTNGRQTSPSDQAGSNGVEPEKERKGPRLSTWAQTMISRGYQASAIMNALRACSARSDLAELVLFETRSGRGIPSDVPGVWSEDEDVTLESGDARGIKRLEEKHGWDECDLRMQYLAERREPDD